MVDTSLHSIQESKSEVEIGIEWWKGLMELSIQKEKAQQLADQIANEVVRAMGLFPSIHNMHEGLGVIREEYIEFEDQVFLFNLRKGRDTRPEARKELIQLAAMCLRTIMDCEL